MNSDAIRTSAAQAPALTPWLPMGVLIATPLAIVPLFGRISTSQAFVFGVLVWYVLAPIAALAILWGLARGRGRLPRIGPLELVIAAWFLTQIAAAAASSWPRLAHLRPEFGLLAMFVAWRLSLSYASTPDDDEHSPAGGRLPMAAFWTLAGLGAVLAFQAILAGIGFNPLAVLNRALLDPEERSGLLTLAGHPNYLGSAIILFFFIKLDRIMGGRETPESRPPWPAMAGVAILGLLDLTALFLVGARGASLALLGGLFAAFLSNSLRRENRRVRTMLGTSLALLLLAAGAVGFLAWREHRQQMRTAQGEGTSLAGRLYSTEEGTTRFQSWLTSVGMFLEHPLLGVGPGTYNTAYWTFLRRHLMARDPTMRAALATLPNAGESDAPPLETAVHPFLVREIAGLSPGHTHNETLHAAATGGSFGLAALLLLGAAGLVLAHAARRPLLVGALAAAAIDAQFNFPLHLPLSASLLALVLGMSATARSSSGRGWGWLIFVVLIAAAHLQSPPQLWGEFRSRVLHRWSARAYSAKEALRLLESAATAYPANFEARRALIDAHLKLNDPFRASTEALNLLGESSHPYDVFRLGEAKLQQGDTVQAAHLFRLAAALAPRYQAAAERRLTATLHAYQESRSAEPERRLAWMTEVLDAVDRLRDLDYSHPLTDYAEGTILRDAGAGAAGLRKLKAAKAEIESRLASTTPEAGAPPREAPERADTLRALHAAILQHLGQPPPKNVPPTSATEPAQP